MGQGHFNSFKSILPVCNGGLSFLLAGEEHKGLEREQKKRSKEKGKIVVFLWLPCPSPIILERLSNFSPFFLVFKVMPSFLQ